MLFIITEFKTITKLYSQSAYRCLNTETNWSSFESINELDQKGGNICEV